MGLLEGLVLGAALGELSDYEKLRVARMEVNTEFLRGLGLA